MPPPPSDSTYVGGGSNSSSSSSTVIDPLLGGPYDVLLLDGDSSANPLRAAVKETEWSVLERFSRVTRLYRNTAAHFLDHPMAKPLLPFIPSALAPERHPIPPPHHEYEPARVYLARFAHELQVARSRSDSVDPGSNPHNPFPNANSPSSNPPSPMLSSSISLLSGSAIAHARTAIPDTAGRLKMLKEESIVWDETVEALTGLGAFEVLSTDTTPPPPKVERLRPLSRAEWALYFDVHRGLPKPIDPPPMSLSDSIIHVSHEESPKEFKGGLGKIVVPVMEIRRRIFAGGVDPEIRPEVWRFLYALYHWDSTHSERIAIKAAKTEEYYRMKREWLDIAERLGEDADMEAPAKGEDPDADMYRDAVVRVDKDVHRTDRGHPFYGQDPSRIATPESLPKRPVGVGPGTPNMNKLRDILITYACSYPGSDRLGFVQGMADLASPILITLEGDEADAFWCFTKLMDKMKSNFRHDGLGMRTHLTTLTSLLKLTDPHLYIHLDLANASNLFCCFRWFLVLFKREFAFADVLKLWEVLASGWGGDEFEYFVALAIMDEHRDAIVRCLMNFDEILKYVNDLSGTIPLDPTLEAAELLYLRFRVRAASVGAVSKTAPGLVPLPSPSSSASSSTSSLYRSAPGTPMEMEGKLRLGEIVERVRDAEESARADISAGRLRDGKKKTE